MSDVVVQLRHEFSIVSDKNETIASATVEMMNGVLWLSNVWTHHEHRKQGHATTILKAVLAEFGNHDLWLRVYPYTNRPRSEEDLTQWYTRFGFGPMETPGTMRRIGNI